MVSADNLPFDVLPLIFSHLQLGGDLLSVALVSRSFFGGALPLIYEEIEMHPRLVKRLRLVCLFQIHSRSNYLHLDAISF